MGREAAVGLQGLGGDGRRSRGGDGRLAPQISGPITIEVDLRGLDKPVGAFGGDRPGQHRGVVTGPHGDRARLAAVACPHQLVDGHDVIGIAALHIAFHRLGEAVGRCGDDALAALRAIGVGDRDGLDGAAVRVLHRLITGGGVEVAVAIGVQLRGHAQAIGARAGGGGRVDAAIGIARPDLGGAGLRCRVDADGGHDVRGLEDAILIEVNPGPAGHLVGAQRGPGQLTDRAIGIRHLEGVHTAAIGGNRRHVGCYRFVAAIAIGVRPDGLAQRVGAL